MRSLITPLLAAAGLVLSSAEECLSANNLIFHEMQIEQVIGGVGGDATAQAIQLRLRDDGECFMSLSRIIAHDAAGQNPLLIIDMQTDVPGCDPGDRVLITSKSFAGSTDQALASDFTMTTLIPESYLAAGSLTFESDGGEVYWRLSWGGDDYTGSHEGDNTNDDDGDFGPAFDGPLPSGDNRALLFQGSADDESTSNQNDYTLTPGPAVFTNNAGQSATVVMPPHCVHDLDGNGSVGTEDLIALLGAWGSDPGGPPDFNGDGNVGATDLIELLGNWGPCS